MFLINRFIKIIFCLFIFTSFASGISFAKDAVGGLEDISGKVNVLRAEWKNSVKQGFLIREKDIIYVGENSKATLVFRDGSSMRLFPNTKLILKKSRDENLDHRIITYIFILEYGSFWGNYILGEQKTIIKTSSADIWINEANILVTHAKNGMGIRLSSGKVKIVNDDESILLKPGYFISGINKSGDFSNKIKKITNILQITSSDKKLTYQQIGDRRLISFSFQLEKIKSKSNINISGDVYVTASSKKFKFPKVKLNKRGYARVVAVLEPFGINENSSSQIEVKAVMEGKEFIETGMGMNVINISRK